MSLVPHCSHTQWSYTQNDLVDHTGKLAAVEEVVGWSNHRAQQHVYVASSPLCYRFMNVVLMKTQEFNFTFYAFKCAQASLAVSPPYLNSSMLLPQIWNRSKTRQTKNQQLSPRYVLCDNVSKPVNFKKA